MIDVVQSPARATMTFAAGRLLDDGIVAKECHSVSGLVLKRIVLVAGISLYGKMSVAASYLDGPGAPKPRCKGCWY
jgi:chloramphenicol 3-O-phosphotransferase